MVDISIGVIGCGNMASAIVKGFYNKNNQVKFLTFTPTYTRAEALAREVNGTAVRSIHELSRANTIVLACKPQQFEDLSRTLKDSKIDLSSKHIISILAATSIRTLQEKLGAKRVTRVMPNTPALIGKGMSLIMHSSDVLEEDKSLVDEFFTACGDTALMPNETTFDQVTTVSGSGPAYVFLFAKTMADKLVSWGLDEAQAKHIAIQLFIGSSELMRSQKDESLEDLISKVTSKGGVTIEAVKSYKSHGLETLTSNALESAYNRSLEIAEALKS